MNTLTGIEAERVVQILKHASSRLGILATIPLQKDNNLLKKVNSGTTIELLQRQWLAEDQLKNLSDGSYSEAGGRDISLLKQAHRSVRATSRHLMSDSTSMDDILCDKPESNPSRLLHFVKYLNDLSQYVHSRLTTTVEDEASNRTILQELTERECHAEESRDALQSKLAEVCEEKEHVTFGLDQTLRKLQVELQELVSNNKVEMDAIQIEMNDAISKAGIDHELRMRHLQDQVDGVERQLLDVVEKNREEEQRLRKDKTRAENALNSKILQYDSDMLSRRAALDLLKKEYAEEMSEYKQLSEYFNRMDLDAVNDTGEQGVLRTVQCREEFAMKFIDLAVSKIQALVRGRKVRNALKSTKKKKESKKKGGKKKK